MTENEKPLPEFKNANPKYVYKITYDDVVIGDTIFFGPRVQKLHADTLKPVINDEKQNKI
jgi:hypothetical protein